ncbi:MAG: hypothetical protein ACI9WU_005319 [Myxococcota bacterium]|jgi:hypothetical protein
MSGNPKKPDAASLAETLRARAAANRGRIAAALGGFAAVEPRSTLLEDAPARARMTDDERAMERYLWKAGDVDARTERCQALTDAVLAQDPGFVKRFGARPLWRMTAQPWVGEPGTWAPKRRGKGALASLVRHLFGTFEIPGFLDSTFTRREADERFVEVVAIVGRGESLAKASAGGLLPAPLTRRMCHDWLETPARWDVVRAMRRAQALGFGAEAARADAVAHSRLGLRLNENEAFWQTVIQWIVDRSELGDGQIDTLVDYLGHARGADPQLEITGRSLKVVLREMHAWLAQLHAQRRGPDAELPTSGLADASWSEHRDGQVVLWSMGELTSLAALHAEGCAQRHCVYSYGPQIQTGDISIWSLRGLYPDGGGGRLTVEVDRRANAVVQVKGADNVVASVGELAALAVWAGRVGVSVGV